MNNVITPDVTNRLQNAREAISKNFFAVDGVIDRLEMSVVGNLLIPRSTNIIFYGKGGYGKSEIVEQYLREATGTEPFVVNMNQATAPADIFGGMNIPKLTQLGEMEYNFDNSFMAHEWAIFEEGLESRPKVLSSLKYVLTSGIFAAAGVAARPIATKGIIIVTNIDTADFMDSEDTKAFIERFPITYKVGWESLNQYQRFNASLKVVEKFDTNNSLTYEQRRIIAETAATKLDPPRTIAAVVRALIAQQSLHGGGTISNEVFLKVTDILRYGDKNLATKLEQERIATEVRNAKAQYEVLFDKLNRNLEHYRSLSEHLNDPRYIMRVANQIVSSMKLISEIRSSVIDIRTNPNYGQQGNELASWINTEVGRYADDLEEIKRISWDGVLITIGRLVEKLEDAGVDF